MSMNQKRRKGVESYDHTSLVETMSVFQTALVTKLLFFFNNNMKLQHFLSNCYFHRNPQICLVVFNNNIIKKLHVVPSTTTKPLDSRCFKKLY